MKDVLIVYDDPSMRQALVNVVQFWGYQSGAISSSDALSLENLPSIPDVILLQFVAPISDTIELLREIRSNEATASVPVIVIAAADAPDYKQICLENGAFDYLGGRWSLEDLRSAVRLAVGNGPTRRR